MSGFNETELENAVSAAVKFLEDVTDPGAMPTPAQRATLKAWLAYRRQKDTEDDPLVETAMEDLAQHIEDDDEHTYVKADLRPFARVVVEKYFNDNVRAECWNSALHEVLDSMIVRAAEQAVSK
jgi:hypothetical protein